MLLVRVSDDVKLYAWASCVLCVIHVLVVGIVSTRNSPSADEVAHLAAGTLVWEHGRFDLYMVNPPLVRVVAAAIVRVIGVLHFRRSLYIRRVMSVAGAYCGRRAA